MEQDIYKLVHCIFSSGKFPRSLNSTFISIIPKTDNPQNMSQFWPISLCNTIYKIVSKIIVHRIRPFLDKLISPNQASFIPERQIIDNMAVV